VSWAAPPNSHQAYRVWRPKRLDRAILECKHQVALHLVRQTAFTVQNGICLLAGPRRATNSGVSSALPLSLSTQHTSKYILSPYFAGSALAASFTLFTFQALGSAERKPVDSARLGLTFQNLLLTLYASSCVSPSAPPGQPQENFHYNWPRMPTKTSEWSSLTPESLLLSSAGRYYADLQPHPLPQQRMATTAQAGLHDLL
jgi:hypothetical protein